MNRSQAVYAAIDAIDGVSVVIDNTDRLDGAWILYAHDDHTMAEYTVTIDDEGVQVEHENSYDFSSCDCADPGAQGGIICRDCSGVR